MMAMAKTRKQSTRKPLRAPKAQAAGSGPGKVVRERAPRLKKRTCFVIMPFGTKRATVKNRPAGANGAKDASQLWKVVGLNDGKFTLDIDFDAVYEQVIKRAMSGIEQYEIEVKRCDEIKYSGWIHEKMIEQIANADIAIVELTTLNPNVFYELGVRHALNESVTVLIQQEGLEERIPFNLGGMSIIKYDPARLDRAREEIQQTVTESLARREHVDSLVFKTLPSLRVTVRQPRKKDERELHHFPLPDLPGRCLGVVTGDIANVEDIDIWVSSENTEMMMARYHERAISATIRFMGARRDATDRIADDIIEKALRETMGGVNAVPPGSVVVTTSGMLRETNRVNWIFHAASVIGQVGGGYHPIADVSACVNNALKRADSKSFRKRNRAQGLPEVRTILFPLFATGQAHADLEDTIDVLMRTAKSYLTRTGGSTLQCVYFLAYTDRDYEACRRALESRGLSEDKAWSPSPPPGIAASVEAGAGRGTRGRLGTSASQDFSPRSMQAEPSPRRHGQRAGKTARRS